MMSRSSGRTAEFLRANGLTLGVGVTLLALAALGVRWIAGNREAPPPRKAMQFTVVSVQPTPQPKPPPPPPQQVTPTKELDEPQPNRIEIRPTDIPPPDAPRPPDAPSGGRLALAAEGEGSGDAFNLAGNPGGRGLLSGGGLGDGSGDGVGQGDASARYGWFFAKVQADIEEALRRTKQLSNASTRVDLRVWWAENGRISRVQLVRSTGNPKLDEAVQSVVGLVLRQPPPRDIPMPLILRLTARRPQ